MTAIIPKVFGDWTSVDEYLPPKYTQVFVYDKVKHTAYHAMLLVDKKGRCYWRSTGYELHSYPLSGRAITLWKPADLAGMQRFLNRAYGLKEKHDATK